MKFFFALLGVALATYSSFPTSQPLAPGNEYIYKFDGQISSGLPQGSESSNTHFNCDVRVQMVDDRSIVLGFDNWQLAASNKQVPTMKQINFDSLERREIPNEHKQYLELPVAVSYRNGLISDLVFSSEEPTWTANIKRSVINMLQLNLEKIDTKSSMEIEKETDLVSVFEKTIEGDCEVLYSVVSGNKNTIVTKTPNFEKCSRRSDIRYHMRFSAECPECEHTREVVPQTVYTYKMEKEQLKEIEVRSLYQVSIVDQPLMKTEITTKLTLIESSPIKRMLKTPRGETQELIYSTQWDEKIERFYKNGDAEDTTIFEKSGEKVAEIVKIVRRIAEMKDQSSQLVPPFSLLFRNLRQCTISELRQLHETLYSKADQKIKYVFEHGLAAAGTKNTIEHLIKLMRQEEISPIKASQLFKSIQETLYPSEAIAKMIQEFSRSEVCRREPILRQSVWLCYGAIVHGVVSPVMEKHLVKEGSVRTKNNFLSVFMTELEKSENTYERILIIKSLANAALDISVPELEKLILNKKEKSVIRREAIDALRLIADQMPRKVQRLLMPVFSDRLERPEIRMSALVQLIQSKPEITVLSQIVTRMERDPNQHVAAMTYRMLSTISESTNPCHRLLASDMKIVLRTALFRPENRIYSAYRHLPLFSHEFLSGMNVNFASVFGKESIIPKEIMASMETLVSGDWSKYFMQVGFTQQNVEQLYNKIVRSFERNIEQSDVEYSQSAVESLKYLKNLAGKMNIKSRTTEAEEPFAMLYFRYKQMDFAMLPLDDEILEELVSKFLRDGAINNDLVQRLFNMEPKFNYFHAASFLERTHQIPTILGVPLLMITAAPSAFSVEGKMSLEKMSYGARFNVNANPSAATTLVSIMKIETPIMEHGVVLNKKIEVSLPLNFNFELTYNKNVEVKLRFTPLEDKKDIVRLVSQPIVYIRDPTNLYNFIPSEVMPARIHKENAQEIEHTTEILGHKFSVSGKSVNQWNLRSLLLEEFDLTLSVEPLRSTPREIVIRVNVEAIKDGRFDMPLVEKMMDKHFEIEEENWTTRDHTSRREQIRKTTRDLTEGYKHRMTVSLEAGAKISEIELRTEIQNELRFWRFLLNGRRPSTEGSEWTMKSLLEVVLPETVTTLQQLKEQKHREVLAHWESMWGAENKNEMTVKLQLEPSKEQLKWVKSLGQKYQPIAEFDLLVKAARLNQVKAIVDYNLSPKNEQYFERWFETLKGYSFWYSKLVQLQGEKKRIALQLTVDQSLSTANLTVRTPKEILEISDVKLPMVVLPSIARDSIFSKTQLRKIVSSECVVKSNKIDSFDNLVFRAPLTTCYSVVAKDCSEKPRYAVLLKKISKKSEEKKLKVVGESTYELEYVDGKMIVSVNGKKVQRSAEVEDYGIEKINDHLWIVSLKEVTVRFDGYTSKVELNNNKMNTHCGLCGHFDGQKDNEFRTAYDDETKDIESFHRSYIVKHEECSMEEEELSNKKNYKMYEEEYEQYDEYSSNDYEGKKVSSSSSERSKPVESTRVIEINHRLCYSTEPISECPKNTIVLRPVEKEFEFNCVPRDSSAARTIKSTLARGQPLRQLSINSSHLTNVRRSVSVPRACEAY